MLDRTSEAVPTAEIILEAGDLNDALRRVRHAMCKEETRYYLNGVYLHYALRDDVLRFVATDGHRLSMADIPAPQGAINLRPAILSGAFVIDAIKATNKTQNAFKHVRLAVGPTRANLTDWDGNAIDGTLIDGTFPDYERVIPRGEPQHGTATLAREPFIHAVAAVTAFAKASGVKRHVTPILRFAFAGDKLTISGVIEGCGSACRGSASVAVDVAETTMREPREIRFHGPQILDILNALRGGEVRFDFFDVGGPNNFVGDRADSHALHVIMPVRV
jgi:DNA polymerase III subunit beta